MKSALILFLFCNLAIAAETDLGYEVDLGTRRLVSNYKLKTILINGSDWTEEKIIASVRKTNQIFKSCGVRFSKVEIAVLNFPTRFSTKDLLLNSRSVTLLGYRNPDKILVVFGGDRISPLEDSSIAFAYRNKPHPGAYKYLKNTAYLTDRALDFRSIPVLAHELGHILLDSKHVKFPNLMMPFSGLYRLGKDQCATLARSPALEKFSHNNP